MNKQAIEMLKSRIEQLNAGNFDLEAWKAGTLVILERIFGPDSQKAKEIEKIRYEQSSWALRDAKGSEKLIDSCKRRGEEVLKVAMEELQFFGKEAGDRSRQKDALGQVILGALEEELKIAQYHKVRELLESDAGEKEKREKVIEMLNGFGHEVVPSMLGFILSHPLTKEAVVKAGK